MRNLFTLFFILTLTNSLAQQVKDTSINNRMPNYNLEGTHGDGKYLNATRKIKYHKTLDKNISAPRNKSLYILKQKGVSDRRLSGFSPLSLIPNKDIMILEGLKDKEAKKIAHKYVKYGVIIVTLNEGVEVLTASQLLDKYKINNKLTTLPLYIDSTLVPNSGKYYYVTTGIKSVSEAVEKGTNVKYISILTYNINYEPDPNAIYTR
jgi:hypothetical protein